MMDESHNVTDPIESLMASAVAPRRTHARARPRAHKDVERPQTAKLGSGIV